jgi:hypothetical protein
MQAYALIRPADTLSDRESAYHDPPQCRHYGFSVLLK